MDKAKAILLDVLRAGAADGGEHRLYRSGRLPGLFSGRTSLHADVAAQALRDGLLELVRTELRGKTPVEWVKVTPKGIDFLLDNDSPLRILEELRETLKLNQEGLPVWVAQVQRQLDQAQKELIDEVASIRQRLDQLAQRVQEAIKRLEPPLPEGAAGALPWDQDAVNYLQQRLDGKVGDRCPLPELFGFLREKRPELTLGEFHSGLRRLHDRGAIRLLPCDSAPPEPEYALLDGAKVYFYAAR